MNFLTCVSTPGKCIPEAGLIIRQVCNVYQHCSFFVIRIACKFIVRIHRCVLNEQNKTLPVSYSCQNMLQSCVL